MAFSIAAPALLSSAEPFTVLSTVSAAAGLILTNDGVLADASDADKLDVAGMLIAAVTAGEYAAVVSLADVRVGNLLTQGRHLVLATAGQVQYDDELVVGQTLVRIGVASTTAAVALRVIRHPVTL